MDIDRQHDRPSPPPFTLYFAVISPIHGGMSRFQYVSLSTLHDEHYGVACIVVNGDYDGGGGKNSNDGIAIIMMMIASTLTTTITPPTLKRSIAREIRQ